MVSVPAQTNHSLCKVSMISNKNAKHSLNNIANTLLNYLFLEMSIYVLLNIDLATGCNEYSIDLEFIPLFRYL